MRFIPNRRSAIIASCAMLFAFAALAVAAEMRNPALVQRQWGAFYTYEVDVKPRMAPGNPPPAYPSSLRSRGVSGKTVVNFVIDENGAAMMRSLRVVEATDSAFTAAVREILPRYRFIPGEMNNQPVRVWITLPFDFILNAGGSASDTSVRRAAAQSTPPQQRTPPQRNVNPDTLGAFYQFEVERMARLSPGNPAPVYPAILKATGQEGTVLVSFVITTTGEADMSTFTVKESTHVLFTEEVRRVLRSYRFIPAQVGGRPVRVWTLLPFAFKL